MPDLRERKAQTHEKGQPHQDWPRSFDASKITESWSVGSQAPEQPGLGLSLAALPGPGRQPAGQPGQLAPNQSPAGQPDQQSAALPVLMVLPVWSFPSRAWLPYCDRRHHRR